MTKKQQYRFVAEFNEHWNVVQQEFGNFNFTLVRKDVDEPLRGGRGGNVYTVFTKDDECGRGEYAEEIDVQIDSINRRRDRGYVRRIAEIVLEKEYDPGLRVAKIVERFGLFC